MYNAFHNTPGFGLVDAVRISIDDLTRLFPESATNGAIVADIIRFAPLITDTELDDIACS